MQFFNEDAAPKSKELTPDHGTIELKCIRNEFLLKTGIAKCGVDRRNASGWLTPQYTEIEQQTDSYSLREAAASPIDAATALAKRDREYPCRFRSREGRVGRPKLPYKRLYGERYFRARQCSCSAL